MGSNVGICGHSLGYKLLSVEIKKVRRKIRPTYIFDLPRISLSREEVVPVCGFFYDGQVKVLLENAEHAVGMICRKWAVGQLMLDSSKFAETPTEIRGSLWQEGGEELPGAQLGEQRRHAELVLELLPFGERDPAIVREDEAADDGGVGGVAVLDLGQLAFGLDRLLRLPVSDF